MSDEGHDGGAGVDDEVALPQLEQFRPVPHLVEPTESSQRLTKTEQISW